MGLGEFRADVEEALAHGAATDGADFAAEALVAETDFDDEESVDGEGEKGVEGDAMFGEIDCGDLEAFAFSFGGGGRDPRFNDVALPRASPAVGFAFGDRGSLHANYIG